MVKTWIWAAAVSALLSGSAAAQSCNTLIGGSDCGVPKRGGPIDFSKPNYDRDDRSNNGFMTPFSGSGGIGSGSIGSELSGNYAPATIGAITFGGGGARCGGLFRSRSC